MLALWLVTVFGLDRLSYWEITPATFYPCDLFGWEAQRATTPKGMGLEKHRDDLFRHWLLGLGSGDLQIRTSAT